MFSLWVGDASCDGESLEDIVGSCVAVPNVLLSDDVTESVLLGSNAEGLAVSEKVCVTNWEWESEPEGRVRVCELERVDESVQEADAVAVTDLLADCA
jgi:hypothetical protein